MMAHVHCTMTNCGTAERSLKSLKAAVIPDLKARFLARFESFNDSLFTNCRWLDPANWTEEEDTSIELTAMLKVADHFRTPLAATAFDEKHPKQEWKSLKHTVKTYYCGVKATNVWQRIILVYRKDKYPNVSLL